VAFDISTVGASLFKTANRAAKVAESTPAASRNSPEPKRLRLGVRHCLRRALRPLTATAANKRNPPFGVAEMGPVPTPQKGHMVVIIMCHLADVPCLIII
jgi:hypothetical protein